MRLAVYHNLGSGGALRVLEAYLHHYHRQHQFELFLPATATDRFVSLGKYCRQVHQLPSPAQEAGKLGPFRDMANLRKLGRMAAAAIDADGFDAALVAASWRSCSPEVLPYLRTPSLYYAPEHFRAIYDEPIEPDRGWRTRLADLVYAPTHHWLRQFDRRGFRAATAVFTHSKFQAEIIRRIYGVRCEVVYLGVDTKLYRPARRRRTKTVLSVGSLVPLKGHQFVIEAVGRLPKEARPSVELIGDRGYYGPALKQLAAEYGVRLRIRQGIPFAQVVTAYQTAALLAAAQYNEPFGLITLEAMATATPVVAVAEGGLQETVTDGKTGLLTPRDPDQFAAAIQRVLTDQKLATRLGTAGRADTLKRWQWSVTAEKIDRLLQKVAGKEAG